jgi:uncharacterized protein with HEPN domain
MTYEQFSADNKTIDAVIRNLEIIGEAAGHIPLEIQEKYPELAWLKCVVCGTLWPMNALALVS